MISTLAWCSVPGELCADLYLPAPTPKKEIHYRLSSYFLHLEDPVCACVSETHYEGQRSPIVHLCGIWGSSVFQLYLLTLCLSTSYFITISLNKSTFTELYSPPAQPNLTTRTSCTNAHLMPINQYSLRVSPCQKLRYRETPWKLIALQVVSLSKKISQFFSWLVKHLPGMSVCVHANAYFILQCNEKKTKHAWHIPASNRATLK